MTSSVSAYTNLESLLLFQCLHAYGVGPSVFGRISDLLKKNPDITTHKHFQAGRLSPDALRNFYLERLRRELELEQGGDGEGQNGEVTSTGKRKRHSPSLPTVQESLQHQHLIPQLVTKLYATYRTEVTDHIRAEEERFERLQRELESIERGEWDDQLRERHLALKALQPNASPQLAQNGSLGGPVTAPTPDPSQPPGSTASTTTAPPADLAAVSSIDLQWRAVSEHHVLCSSSDAPEHTIPAESTPQPRYPQASTPANNRHQPRADVQTPGTGRPSIRPTHPLLIQAQQSSSTPPNTRSPSSVMGTPLSARSFWKQQSFKITPATPASPRPEVEPLDDLPPLIRPHQSPPKAKGQRKSRAKGKGREDETDKQAEPESKAVQDHKPPNDQEEESLLEPETRSGRSRRKAPAKRTRLGSIASSRAGGSVRDRSRSQSVLSHTETVAADNESQTGHRIKSERGTSVDAVEEESAGTPLHMSTRRRAAATQAPLITRRKRNAREASLDEPEDQFSTPGPPKALLGQRQFSKMSGTLMHDINSHKHASTFNTAVRAKDAEGYYEIIKRPTDLASIRKAIAAGAKQVAVAMSDTPTGSPGGGGGVVELPITLDNVPPKSVVNAVQFEQELMRMFVNAVMFNPGEDAVVEDAREMFQTVQGTVGSWRNVGGSSGRAGLESTPTVDEDEQQQQPTAPKRRKL
ncbi:hypothetical protein EJ02DRAFT_398790 [Clathrospora elynae]|uniref:Bromo domain-containing protein n=1 Tax=Clathrospora elynae TaxID=706981 RepID=A0A6A5SVH4_9PLEO|nr:hypothetical protein EJ02DRAFT_398790 [Clathrospora elynae]